MRMACLLVAFSMAASTAHAQDRAPLRASIDRAAAAIAPESTSVDSRHGHGFWPGIGLGAAGVTLAVLGTTALRSEDSSTGNAPTGTYRACVAQAASSPIYATNQCDGLKGKNLPLLWGGVALGAAGAALVIVTSANAETRADVRAGSIALVHRLRF